MEVAGNELDQDEIQKKERPTSKGNVHWGEYLSKFRCVVCIAKHTVDVRFEHGGIVGKIHRFLK